MVGGALLGLIACAGMTGAAICCAVPAPPMMAHGDHRMPMPVPDHKDMPMGCHAVLGCSGSRKLRPAA